LKLSELWGVEISSSLFEHAVAPLELGGGPFWSLSTLRRHRREGVVQGAVKRRDEPALLFGRELRVSYDLGGPSARQRAELFA
jgi:hypothetical protein